MKKLLILVVLSGLFCSCAVSAETEFYEIAVMNNTDSVKTVHCGGYDDNGHVDLRPLVLEPGEVGFKYDSTSSRYTTVTVNEWNGEGAYMSNKNMRGQVVEVEINPDCIYFYDSRYERTFWN